MTPMTMTIERVMAFNALDVLVAKDEGLFAEEGLDLRIAGPVTDALAPLDERSPSNPATTQGRRQARGEAAMYQA
jgi:hypothetical protein